MSQARATTSPTTVHLRTRMHRLDARVRDYGKRGHCIIPQNPGNRLPNPCSTSAAGNAGDARGRCTAHAAKTQCQLDALGEAPGYSGSVTFQIEIAFCRSR